MFRLVTVKLESDGGIRRIGSISIALVVVVIIVVALLCFVW